MSRRSSSAARPMRRWIPCYHLTCDTPDQVNAEVLDQMSDAAAHVLMLLLEGRLL